MTTPAPSTVDVDIDSLTPGGEGLARRGGRTLTVPFTIPGERVRVRLPHVVRPGQDAIPARLETILRASPHRVVAPCRHFGPAAAGAICGGCAWQHIAYPEQLALKTALVQRLVDEAVDGRTPRVALTLPATPVDDPWHFRNKVHLAFGRHRERATLVVGHYARGTRRVIPIDECPVHDAAGDAFAHRLHAQLARAVGRSAAVDQLLHVVIRIARKTQEMAATLVVSHDGGRPIREATKRALARSPQVTSFHLNEHPKDDGFLFGPRTRHISGPARLREDVAGTAFLLSPESFFQTNAAAAEVLVRLVLDAVPAEPTAVLDLYAGAGLFALPLAARGHRVVAIEENVSAVEDGRASQRLQRGALGSCRFVAGRVESSLRAHALGGETVVLDPPRDGCPAQVLEDVFARLKPARAVYVSCNPEALARDLADIAAHGYRPVSLQPVDMFPHTPHVETVVVLARPGRRA